VELTYNSTAIEGNTLSYQETKVLLLDGITIGGKTMREHLEVIDHNEAIDYMEVLSKKNTTELTSSDILNIHAIILKGIDNKNGGKYRDVPVCVLQKNGNKHIFCDPLKINDEMDNYFNWLFSAKDTHPIIEAAEAHTRLVSIHPFIDGNGRTARLIMNLLLLQNGYVPVVIKNSDRVKYLDSIEEWQNNNNKNDFINMVINEEEESLSTYLKSIKENIVWQ
jgi:Fic family protein